MTFWKGAALTAFGIAVAAFVLCHTFDPTVDTVARWMVYATAVPATLFIVLYAFTVPWWSTMIGRALLVSSTALALLIDLSALYHVLGADYLGRDLVRLAVLALVFLGASLKLTALLGEKWAARKARRDT